MDKGTGGGGAGTIWAAIANDFRKRSGAGEGGGRAIHIAKRAGGGDAGTGGRGDAGSVWATGAGGAGGVVCGQRKRAAGGDVDGGEADREALAGDSGGGFDEGK